MFFKKTKKKIILKKFKNLFLLFKKKGSERKLLSSYSNLVLGIEHAINCFVKDSYENNLLSFAVKIDESLASLKGIELTKLLDPSKIFVSNSYKDELEDSFLSEYLLRDLINHFLKKIDFLEFVYLTKKKKNYYLIVVVKGLLGYSNSILSSFYSLFHSNNNTSLREYFVRIKYLKREKEVVKYFNFLVKNSNFSNDYYFKGYFVDKPLGGNAFDTIFTSKEERSFLYEGEDSSRIGLGLKYLGDLGDFGGFGYVLNLSDLRSYKHMTKLYKYDNYYNLYNYDNDKYYRFVPNYKKNVRSCKNDIKVISRRVADEQSIINLWVLYMKANNLYIKNNKIYEKKDSGELVYFSRLEYLKYNIDFIISFLKESFSFQLSSYPIENIILKYLNSAYDKLLVTPYYYLPNLEETDIDKFLKKYDSLYSDLADLEKDEVKLLYELRYWRPTVTYKEELDYLEKNPNASLLDLDKQIIMFLF